MSKQATAIKVILRNYQEFEKSPIDNISVEDPTDSDNIFKWNVKIFGLSDSPYENGVFDLEINYPSDYPFNPPEVKFKTNIYHPNIYKDGKVCISILHPPGDDPNSYELAEERWRPIHTFSSIMISIISLLSDPNDESPANIDAAKVWREDKNEFQKIVNKIMKENENHLITIES